VPAKTVGGDFYQFYKVNEDLVIGIILDVSGKGITAALNISAVYVLFLQEVLATHEPSKITKNLNRKLINFFQENYIAACCFSMDFSKKQLKIVGAGINQFMFQKSGAQVEIKTVEGAFLGMFPNSVFEEQVIQFHQKDRVFFFTDGLDFILDEDKVIRDYMEEVSIIQFTNYINEFLNDTLIETGSLMDDCTMVALEII
jgi:serine phosphatase RsbU (regulator of sigma subunit)